MPGILMSRNTRSGASRSASASAFLAGRRAEHVVALVLEDHPQRVADRRSSSMTRMRGFIDGCQRCVDA